MIRAVVIALTALSPAFNCLAQQRTVDLQVTVGLSALHFERDELKTLWLTIRNKGPEIASQPSIRSSWYDTFFPGQQFDIVAVEQTAPCDLVYLHLDPQAGNPVPYSAHVWFPPLQPGEDMTCAVGIRSTPTATGSFALSFTAFDGRYFPSSDVQDPDPGNNSVAVGLGFPSPAAAAAVTVPATSSFTAWLMSTLFVIGGLIACRRPASA